MSRNPYQRNNNNNNNNRGQHPPSQSRPIANPYAARNNNNRSDNGSSNSGSGRSALSLMTGPLNTTSPTGIMQESADAMTTNSTAANSTHSHSTTYSSNPYSSAHNTSHNQSYESNGNYNDADRIEIHGQHDNDTNAMDTNVNNTSNQQAANANDMNAKQQIQELQQQLQALHQKLQEQSETNFDLNATIATMQAEMDHTLQTSTQQHKEEASKLQHLLRLEQQKSRRLEAQHQQRMQQQQSPLRKRPASQSVFTKRLEAQAGMTAAAPAIPQNISLPTNAATHTNPTGAASVATNTASLPPPQAPPTPPPKEAVQEPPPRNDTDFSISKQKAKPSPAAPVPVVTATTTIESTKSGARRLAQHILQSILESSRRRTRDENSGSVKPAAETTATETNTQPAKNGKTNGKTTDENDDVEMAVEAQAPKEQDPQISHPQVQQVLLDIASGDGDAWSEVQLVEYILRQENAWEFWYPALEQSRLGRRELIKAIQKRYDELHQNDPMAVEESDERGRGSSSRITRLGQAGGKAKLDSSLEAEIWDSLLDPGWDAQAMASMQATVQSRLHQESKTEEKEEVDLTTIISSGLAYRWLQKLVEFIGNQEVQLQALRLLHLVIEESNDAHDQTAFWEVCREPMEAVMEGLYRQWMLEMAKLIKEQTAKNAASSNVIFSSRVSGKSRKKGAMPKRRIRAMPVEELVMETREIGDIEGCLAVALSIWKDLVSCTTVERLDLWFQEKEGVRMVSIVLDMLEEHERLHDMKNRPANPTYYNIKGWYLDAIQYLSTVGTNETGMLVLRTRTRPANVSSPDLYWMGNTLDVAIRQLFSLVMDQEQDARKPFLHQEFPMRTLAIEGWVRLWHQVLLYVQNQQLPDKQPVALSFRSLLLDHQNWYTSACAVLLADQERTREDIQAMLRLQLEELSMDEEEYEELRGN